VLGLVPSDANGRFLLPEVLLQEGENSFTATATDAAGNVSDDSALLGVTLDTVPPAIVLSAPEEGLFTIAAALAVSGSVDEPIAGVTVNGQAATLSGQDFTLAALELLQGVNQIAVTATDLAGNTASIARGITRDTIPPTISISAPQDGLLTREATVMVSGSVDEPILTLSLDGQSVPFNSQEFNLPAVALAEQSNLLTLAATDRAGNLGSVSVSVLRDSTSPAPPQLTPPASPTNLATTALGGSTEPGSSVAVTVLRPDGSSETLATLTAGADGSFSLADIALVEGENSLTATATDAAGNSSEISTPVIVERDSVAPIISISAPADGSVSDLLDIVVTGTVDEVDAVLTIDGTGVPLAAGAFTHPLTLQPGSNTLILLATDPAGNTGTASVTVQADGTPPTVTISAPVSGSLTSQAKAT
jgi:hypothetical protein